MTEITELGAEIPNCAPRYRTGRGRWQPRFWVHQGL